MVLFFAVILSSTKSRKKHRVLHQTAEYKQSSLTKLLVQTKVIGYLVGIPKTDR